MKDTTNTLGAYLAVSRPAHWVKNSFVFAPLLFSREFLRVRPCVQTLIAAGSFCLLSSAVYIFNDLRDRKEDRLHPVKKNRPIAKGTVRPGPAWILLAALVLLGLGGAAYLNTRFVVAALLYVAMNGLYSLGLKHVVILDVMLVAAGFVLRILGGSFAIGVEPSHWLVLCTLMISLFLGFSKRRMELVSIEQAGDTTRKVLRYYSVPFLDLSIAMISAATLICYTLYTVDDHTLEVLGSRAMLISVPSVIYGLFRYLYLLYSRNAATDPVALICRDAPTVINLVLWVALSALAVCYGSRLDPFH